MIIETFRKGQLVPKRLGFLKVHKKARHRVTFMSDVRVEICPTTKQVNIYKLDEEEKSVIHLPHKIGIKRNNKTYQKVDKITIEKCFIFMKPIRN